MSAERVEEIKRKGCVVVRDVVDDDKARTWQIWLREYVTQNKVDGEPRMRGARVAGAR